MKHKTHTVEASGAGKDRATDRIQTALKDRARWTNEERGKDESGQLKAMQRRGGGSRKSGKSMWKKEENSKRRKDQARKALGAEAM